jgi:hypothetical protein
MTHNSGTCLNYSNEKSDLYPMDKVGVTIISDRLNPAPQNSWHEGYAEKIDDSEESAGKNNAALILSDPKYESARRLEVRRTRITNRNMIKGSWRH